MYASFKNDSEFASELVGIAAESLIAWTDRPPTSLDSIIPSKPDIKCAFGWIAAASSDPDTAIILSGRYFDDSRGTLTSGLAIPRTTCTDKCGLAGNVYRFPSGGLKFNMYVMGSSTITTGDETLSFSRSGGINWKDGKYRRFPGPP